VERLQQTDRRPAAVGALGMWCDSRVTYGGMLISVGRVMRSIKISVHVCWLLVLSFIRSRCCYNSSLLYNYMNVGNVLILSVN